jgi:hypothetical protein
MEEIEFSALMLLIEERRIAHGITDADDKARQNSGFRRTHEKREFLQAIADRCREAGIDPLPANY